MSTPPKFGHSKTRSTSTLSADATTMLHTVFEMMIVVSDILPVTSTARTIARDFLLEPAFSLQHNLASGSLAGPHAEWTMLRLASHYAESTMLSLVRRPEEIILLSIVARPEEWAMLSGAREQESMLSLSRSFVLSTPSPGAWCAILVYRFELRSKVSLSSSIKQRTSMICHRSMMQRTRTSLARTIFASTTWCRASRTERRPVFSR